MVASTFEGTKAYVRSAKHGYVGWVVSFSEDRTVLLRSATRDDGRQFASVAVDDPEWVSKVEPVRIRYVDVADIESFKYDVRRYEQRHDQDAIRQQLKSGHLFYFPLVRERPSGKYEVMDGFYRVERARMLGYSTIAVQVVDFDDLAAARLYVQEHIPLPDERPDPSHNFESQQSFVRVLELLNEDWSLDELSSFAQLERERRALERDRS